MTGIVKLFTDVGAAAGIDITGEFRTWFGGPGDFIVYGNFGGGTIQLELTPNDGGIVICITGTKLRNKGVVRFHLNHGFKIRAILRNTTSASSGIFAEVF